MRFDGPGESPGTLLSGQLPPAPRPVGSRLGVLRPSCSLPAGAGGPGSLGAEQLCPELGASDPGTRGEFHLLFRFLF